MNSFNMFSFCLFSVMFLSSHNPIESRKDRIKLKDIQVLTLKPNQWTTGRRSQAVPQLQCVGGYCEAIKGETVQCYNRGSDGIDIQWECKSNIKSGYKFDALDVICEGFDRSDDPYVLVGSCGLEYRIDIDSKTQNGFVVTLFVITLLVIIIIIAWSILYLLKSPNDTNYSTQWSYFGSRAQFTPYFFRQRSRSTDSPKTTTSGFGGTKRR